jgi:hypothetical protein
MLIWLELALGATNRPRARAKFNSQATFRFRFPTPARAGSGRRPVLGAGGVKHPRCVFRPQVV